MKTIATLLAATVVPATTLSATGFDFDVAFLISVGAITGVLGLFAFEYRRVRHRSGPTPVRRQPIHRSLPAAPASLAKEIQAAPFAPQTCER